ncbi:MAG TPA: hypothetical protein VNU93_01215 [Verrucomicrobiae bacterium]|nr:hypothetical protein [Verrucomicrobiae bacterium]
MSRIEVNTIAAGWVNRLGKKLIIILLAILGVLLVLFILSSTRLVTARGERDTLNEVNLNLVKNQLADTAQLMGKLSAGPSGPGDNELNDLAWVNKQALLLKHSGAFTVLDDSPGFRKSGFRFGEALEELQLVLYNLDLRMTKYHYRVNDTDRARAKEMAKSIHDLQEMVLTLKEAAYSTGGAGGDIIQAYKAKADIVTKQSRDFLEVLKKE